MSPPTRVDGVLAAPRPSFTAADVLDIARRTFGIGADAATDLGSERDQAFLLEAAGGDGLAVCKLSNAAEDPAILDMEALAALHASRVDPDLPLALPLPVPDAGATDAADPARYRASVPASDGVHYVRLYELLPGHRRTDPIALDDAALAGWGEMTARLGQALRSFHHPALGRRMLWDIQHAADTRAFLPAVRDPALRALAERALDRFDEVLAPDWPRLRAQAVHTDLTTDNALVSSDGRITGIVDFGDMAYSALIVDLAGALDSLLAGRPADELFRVTRLVLDGYQRIVPLEELELRRLGEAIATRAAVTIAISSWRSSQGLEDAAFAERYNADVGQTIDILLTTGWDEVARRFGADVPRAGGERLIARRSAAFGPAIEPLTYQRPLHLVSASGVWMTDIDGRRYLDAYNNVPCLGHGHPRVTEAIARQARRLNTNLRYLHETAIELGERLIATMPPGLDTVFYVNSGSEANDLAWRLATTATGRRGGACTDYAYHGISEAIAAFSPESWKGTPPAHVATWRPDDPTGVASALADLAARGTPGAAVILDGVLTSDGYPTVSPDLAEAWLGQARAAGAVWIADEVQGGHGRTGDALWSFEHLGLIPDIVTIGKPMGNGHPIGAVVTRRELADAFADETVFFSTFGGNPVAVAAAMAVLDVIEDERVLDRTERAGHALREAIREIAARHPGLITEVRGVGLAIGVESPDTATTGAIKEGLRERGVLVGTSGRAGNVLKVRPPLAFTTAEVSIVADALDATLAAIERGER
jgi:4-aminobutyrate aminotransferase-like enzyme/Ser/Thr protein kinase RdoA (MazF antagonist)